MEINVTQNDAKKNKATTIAALFFNVKKMHKWICGYSEKYTDNEDLIVKKNNNEKVKIFG